MIVYLAGGLRPTELRDQVKAVWSLEHTVIDPAECPHVAEEDYTAWKLAAISRADVVVAFMEDDNPSGYGMAFEVGFAYALGKRVVFYDRLTDNRRPYFGMVRSVSEVK